MSAYEFETGIYNCVAGGHLIILDLGRNRYFSLNPEAQLAIGRLESGTSIENDEPVLDRLVSRKILRRSAGVSLARKLPEMQASRRDYTSLNATVGVLSVSRAILGQAAAMLALRALPLKQSLNRVARKRSRYAKAPGCGEDIIAFSVAAAFRNSAFLLSHHNRCLERSIAMANQLSREGCWSNIIFGVATRPFRAHAWVQYKDVLLSDIADNVRLYSPIFVL